MKMTKCLMFIVGFCTLLTACSTQTRLGQIIPGHRLSEQENGELVTINVIKIGTKQIKALGSTNPAVEVKPEFIDPGLASMAAGLAIDFAKGELEKEAERYEAQFEKKVWLTTSDLGSEATYIVLSRWVKPRRDVLGDFFTAPRPPEVKSALSAMFAGAPTAQAPDLEGLLGIKGTTKTGLSDRELAFLFVLELKPHGNTHPFTIRPAFLWSWKTKAKVVAFDYGSAWKPWKWLGAIIFQGDSKVNYKVELALESLMNLKTKDSAAAVPAMVNTGPADPIIPNLTHTLGQVGLYEFEDNVGGWFDVPEYTSGHEGFFTVQIKVSESDASNVKKKLVKGANYLGDNKQNLLQSITGQK